MRRILRNCAHAARPNGKVLVVEETDTEHGESASTEMDLRMLAYFLGRERSLDRLTDFAHEAGLALGTVTPARTPFHRRAPAGPDTPQTALTIPLRARPPLPQLDFLAFAALTAPWPHPLGSQTKGRPA
ncbi:MAG: hypothetical protein M3170_03490 [Candidatus Dormibacteraeota bacterium]|nr:hypothetical protein [Candidatus Dormibacteraeota bacterium]